MRRKKKEHIHTARFMYGTEYLLESEAELKQKLVFRRQTQARKNNCSLLFVPHNTHSSGGYIHVCAVFLSTGWVRVFYFYDPHVLSPYYSS